MQMQLNDAENDAEGFTIAADRLGRRTCDVGRPVGRIMERIAVRH